MPNFKSEKQTIDMAHPAVEAFNELLQAICHIVTEFRDDDTEEMLQQCRHWNQLLGAGREPSSDGSIDLSEQDWQDVKAFALELIKFEHEFAQAHVDDFRHMIWMVIQGLHDAFQGEQSTDNLVMEHLERLRLAAKSNSVEVLRTGIVEAVDMIGRTIDARKKNQRQQLEELGSQLNQMRSELLKAQREMSLEPMTRLYNRASFDDLLEKTIELSIFSGQTACLFMIDIDHFKTINDKYGHVCGDQVVVKVSDCLKKTFPRKTDFVARYGGDEFTIILQDTALLDGEMLAKRLLDLIKKLVISSENGEEIVLSISVGVAALRSDDTAKSWIERADDALYQAKRAGRGCVRMAGAGEKA